jgi:hypothetical protein
LSDKKKNNKISTIILWNVHCLTDRNWYENQVWVCLFGKKMNFSNNQHIYFY